MGKCSSKLDRVESDSSFHVRGEKPLTTQSGSGKQPAATKSSLKEKFEEEVPDVEQQLAYPSGESSQSSSLLRKRNTQLSGLSLQQPEASTPPAADSTPSSSSAQDEGPDTFHDASEELASTYAHPTTPKASAKSTQSSRFESPVFTPKTPATASTPPGYAEKDLASAQARSTSRLSSSISLPSGRGPQTQKLTPTLSSSSSLNVSKGSRPDLFPVLSASDPSPVVSQAAEGVEMMQSKKPVVAKEHAELGDNWEFVADDTSLLSVQGLGSTASLEKEVEPGVDEATKEAPFQTAKCEDRGTAPAAAIEGAETQEIQVESDEVAKQSETPALAASEGYTAPEEEPPAPELEPVSIISRSDSEGSGDFEIIRGPEDERSTPGSSCPQISESNSSQPEIVEPPVRTSATATDEELAFGDADPQAFLLVQAILLEKNYFKAVRV